MGAAAQKFESRADIQPEEVACFSKIVKKVHVSLYVYKGSGTTMQR